MNNGVTKNGADLKNQPHSRFESGLDKYKKFGNLFL